MSKGAVFPLKKELVTGSPVGEGMSVRFFLPSPPKWNSIPLLHEHLSGPLRPPFLPAVLSILTTHTPWGPMWLCLSRAKHLDRAWLCSHHPSAAPGNGTGDPNPRGPQMWLAVSLSSAPRPAFSARRNACPNPAVPPLANCNLSWVVITENTPQNGTVSQQK